MILMKYVTQYKFMCYFIVFFWAQYKLFLLSCMVQQLCYAVVNMKLLLFNIMQVHIYVEPV